MTLPPPTLSTALQLLESARYPEAILGPDVSKIGAVYRSWAKVVHEDRVGRVKAEGKTMAHRAFILLTKWYEEANAKVARGTYGDNQPSVLATLRTKTAHYDLMTLTPTHHPFASIYEGVSGTGIPCIVKFGRAPCNNDLMKTEADLLARLSAELDPKHTAYFPNLLDSFEAQVDITKVRVNVFTAIRGGASLADIRAAYPEGIHVKDAAWMWNRLLEALHLLHTQDIVHGSVTPDSVYVVPETHQGFLTDFCYSVPTNRLAKALDPKWRALYPPETTQKKNLDFASDIYQAGHMLNYLLGADYSVARPKVPRGTPVAIAGLIHACWLSQRWRFRSAQEVYRDFKEVREGLRWEKEFREFNLVESS